MALQPIGERALRTRVNELPFHQRSLIQELLVDPEPLLRLDSHEGRVASWVLMRLAVASQAWGHDSLMLA